MLESPSGETLVNQEWNCLVASRPLLSDVQSYCTKPPLYWTDDTYACRSLPNYEPFTWQHFSSDQAQFSPSLSLCVLPIHTLPFHKEGAHGFNECPEEKKVKKVKYICRFKFVGLFLCFPFLHFPLSLVSKSSIMIRDQGKILSTSL